MANKKPTSYDDDHDHDDDQDDDDVLFDDEFVFEETPRHEPVSIQEAIAALRDSEASDGAFNDTILYGLSRLSQEDIDVLAPYWATLDVAFRQLLLSELGEASMLSYEADYTALAHFALRDPEPEVRAEAIDLHWHDVSLNFMAELMQFAQNDSSELVRASALRALGPIILAGELEDLPIEQTNQAQLFAERVYRNADEPLEVRRAALEALANSSNDNVNPAIEAAYASEDDRLKISAVTAMGKSCDSRWSDIVLDELDNRDDEMRLQAVQAAGEIQIEDAIPRLGRLCEDDDPDIAEAAVIALGEIGGPSAVRILTHLLDQAVAAEDEGAVELLEDAISSASIGDGPLTLLNLDD